VFCGFWQAKDPVEDPGVHGRVDQEENEQHNFQQEGFPQRHTKHPGDGWYQHQYQAGFEAYRVGYTHVQGPVGHPDAPFEGLKEPVEDQIPGQRDRGRQDTDDEGWAGIIAEQAQDDRRETDGEDLKNHRIGNAACQRRREYASSDERIAAAGSYRYCGDAGGLLLFCGHDDRLSKPKTLSCVARCKRNVRPG